MSELGDGMTIEELSFRSGVTTRNIRAYQSRGLIPPPESRPGHRAAFYRPDHLARLRLIDRLQQRGFSLAGIGDLLAAWEDGRSLDQVLGMESAVADSTEDESITLSEEQLQAMAPADSDARSMFDQLRALGLIIREGTHYRLPHPQILELGLEAARSGIPQEELLAEFERVRRDAARIAERFVQLYERHVWRPYRDAGLPAERLAEILAQIKRLRRLAVTVTRPVMADALTEVIETQVQDNLPLPEDFAGRAGHIGASQD